MGVSVEKGKYRARVYHKGKNYHVGSYDTELKAKRAISRFKKKMEMEDAHADFQLGFEPVKETRSKKQIAHDIASTGRSRLGRVADKIRSWKR